MKLKHVLPPEGFPDKLTILTALNAGKVVDQEKLMNSLLALDNGEDLLNTDISKI